MPRLLSLSKTLSLVTLLFLMACAPAPSAPPSPTLQSGFPITVNDQFGRTVTIQNMPTKIISIAPGNTEIVYALGLEDKLIGVTEYDDYPEAAKAKPKIGGFSTPDIERIVALQPDLVLAANIHEKLIVPRLESLGIPVITLSPNTLNDVLQAIEIIGKAAGRQTEAAVLTANMRSRIDAVTERTANLSPQERLRVLYAVWHDPLMVPGGNTMIDELISRAGGNNIGRDLKDYASISLEVALQADPQVMIASVGHGTGKDLPLQFLRSEPRLKDTEARRNGRVYAIDGNLTSRAGPRIVDGLEQLARLIHPELFQERK